MRKTVISFLILLGVFLTAASATLAWFVNLSFINSNMPASAVTGYFRSGDGSKQDPFVISVPTHVYNLAWLQYMGMLNGVKDGKITQYYFRVEDIDDGNKDGIIDMTGIVLPPIGTEEFPFVGHFDGNGCCIKGLTVSNYMSTQEGDAGIVNRPFSVTNINSDAVSIVGFFGVVGAVSDEMENMLIKEDPEADVRDRVNCVHDLFLDDLTVRTESKESLIGLLAGYVNGSVGNVGIGQSSIELGANVAPLSDSDIADITQMISVYSLVGQYNENNVFWQDAPVKDWVDDNDGNAGWGGSLDMFELNKRLSYIYGAASKTSSYFAPYRISGAFDLVAAYNDKGHNYTSVDRPVYLESGTVLPLSVDTQTMFVGPETQGTLSSYSSKSVTVPYYQTHTSEIVRSGNNGYIVSAGSGSASSIGFRASYPLSDTGIYRSLATKEDSKGGTTPFRGENFQMLTIDLGGNTCVILDDHNGSATTAVGNTYTKLNYTSFNFQNYTTVRDAMVETLESQDLIHAIHFSPKITISNPAKVSATVSLFNETHTNYEMLSSAINFSLADPGIVTAVAATNYINDAVYTHTLFTIFTFERENGEIKTNTIERIDTVHAKYQMVEEEGELKRGAFIEYVYNLEEKNPDYENDTEHDYELKYNATAMNNLKEHNAAYYFEIPLNEGDYAIGECTDRAAIDGKSVEGAYLMYLDIGANGNQSTDNETGTETSHAISGVNFVNMDDLTTVTVQDPLTAQQKTIKSTSGYSVVVCEIKMNENVTTHNGLRMDYNRTSKTEMTYSKEDPSSAFTAQWAAPSVSVQLIQPTLATYVYSRRREE